ncbi:MAG: protein kinase [Oscillospiraceae bacterium]|nr:protein kinase [Oscillospiraceae bacterium]
MDQIFLGNRYELYEEIGSGGMAHVFKARDTLLDRIVAIKILKPEYTEDTQFIERFRIEAKAAASLSNSSIVMIYDVGQDDGIYYIIMEYVDGITLKEYIASAGRIPWKEGVSIAIQMTQAIASAHSNNIIHRDIKPQNVLMTRDRKIKITDFGIARAASSTTITTVGNAMGSVHYFSPEQAKGALTDEKSDIYSLGITLYEMLTGNVPFEGETPIAVALKHIQEPPVEPSRRNPQIPQGVSAIILKSIEKDKYDRYQSMGEMLADLNIVMKDPSGETLQYAATAAAVYMGGGASGGAGGGGMVVGGGGMAGGGGMVVGGAYGEQMPYDGRVYNEQGQYDGRPYDGRQYNGRQFDGRPYDGRQHGGGQYYDQDGYSQSGDEGYTDENAAYQGNGYNNGYDGGYIDADGYAADGYADGDMAPGDEMGGGNRRTGRGRGARARGGYQDTGGSGRSMAPAQSERGRRGGGDRGRGGKRDDGRGSRSGGYTGVFVVVVLIAVLAAIGFVVWIMNNLFGAIQPPALISSSESDTFSVDRYIGRSYEEVYDELRTAGIRSQENRVANDVVEEGLIVTQSIEQGRILRIGGPDTIVFEVSDGARRFTVPDYREYGSDSRAAEAELRANNLDVNVVDESNSTVAKGYVIRTEPGAGSQLSNNARITIFRSSGSDVTQTLAPSLIGKTFRESMDLLDGANLSLGSVSPESVSSTALVIRQSVAPNTVVDEGVSIDLWFEDDDGPPEDTTTEATTEPEPEETPEPEPEETPEPTPTPTPEAPVETPDPGANTTTGGDAPTTTEGPTDLGGEPINITILLSLPVEREYGDTIKVLVEATPSDTGRTTRLINRSVMKDDFPKAVDFIIPAHGSVEIVVYYDGEFIQNKPFLYSEYAP